MALHGLVGVRRRVLGGYTIEKVTFENVMKKVFGVENMSCLCEVSGNCSVGREACCAGKASDLLPPLKVQPPKNLSLKADP